MPVSYTHLDVYKRQQELRDLLEEIGGSKVIDIWRTSDVRSGREDKIWLNALVKKRQ